MVKVTGKFLSSKQRVIWVVVCIMAAATMLEYFILKYSTLSTAQFGFYQQIETVRSNDDAHSSDFVGTLDRAKDTDWSKPLLGTKRSKKSSIDKDVYDILKMKPIKFDPMYKNPCFFGNGENGPIADGKLHCLPYFYLTGMKKSGTSDLFKRIELHPEFISSGRKELQWFPRLRWKIHKPIPTKLTESCTDIRSVACYIKMFDGAALKIKKHRDGKRVNPFITADGTPANLHMHTNWALLPGNEGLMEPKITNFHQINHITPNAKIVIIIRDPVLRLYSDYWHMSNKRKATPEEFHDHVTKLTHGYSDCFNRYSLRRCIYNETMRHDFIRKNVLLGESFTLGFIAFYMTELRNVFGKKRIHPVLTNEYHGQMNQILNDVYKFLDMRKLNSSEMQKIIKRSTANATEKKTDSAPNLSTTSVNGNQFIIHSTFLESFKASTGWLASFLKRNNIVLGTMSGERGDVDINVVNDWKSKLPNVCDGYQPKDIFNMDETGLFYRDTTRKSYHLKGEELAGGKHSKERITVALCASMTGEKLKPLVIGKSAKPRCFNRIKPEKLPVTYKNNKKAWMTSELMVEWLKVDRQMKKSGRNILLFLDNAPGHPKVTLDNVKLAFLPANTTSLAQLMDQGIIQTLKLKYRSRQLKYILSKMDHSDKVVSTILRVISILDAIYWIYGLWKEVEASTIQKCFAKCGFSEFNVQVDNIDSDDKSDDDDDDEVPLAVLILSNELFRCTFSDLVDIDKAVPTFDMNSFNWDRNAREMIKDIRDSKNDDDDDDDISDIQEKKDIISMSEPNEMLYKLKDLALSKGQDKWLEGIMSLQDSFMSCRNEVDTKQSKISDFFK